MEEFVQEYDTACIGHTKLSATLEAKYNDRWKKSQ